MQRGYIYILINPSLQKNMLKIGKTTRTPEDRVKELSASSGVATPFYIAYELEVENCDEVERMIHQNLDKYRYMQNREFFQLSLKKAITMISEIASPYENTENHSFYANENGNDTTQNEAMLYYKIGLLLNSEGNSNATLYMQRAALMGHSDAKKYMDEIDPTSIYKNMSLLELKMKLEADIKQYRYYDRQVETQNDREKYYQIGLLLKKNKNSDAILYIQRAALMGHSVAQQYMDTIDSSNTYKQMGLLEIFQKTNKLSHNILNYKFKNQARESYKVMGRIITYTFNK